MLEARIATTAEEREAIYRHRYDVYVEELGRYFDRADHAHRRLVDPEDDHSDLVYIADGGEVIASLRNTWGGQGFSQRQVDRYNLAPFLADLPAEVLVVGERTMVAPSHRGTDVFALLAAKAEHTIGADQVLIAFGACEPHLIAFYSRWQRPYAARNINHPESGYLIPLIAFKHGIDRLRGVGAASGRLPACVENAVAGTGAVLCSHLTDPDDYLAIVARAIDHAPNSALANVREHLDAVIAGSNIITCAEGDTLVRRHGTAHTLYIVLDGATTDGDTAGAAVGHSAALDMPDPERDVTIAVDGTHVLALSERTLRRLTTEDTATIRILQQAIDEHTPRDAGRG